MLQPTSVQKPLFVKVGIEFDRDTHKESSQVSAHNAARFRFDLSGGGDEVFLCHVGYISRGEGESQRVLSTIFGAKVKLQNVEPL